MKYFKHSFKAKMFALLLMNLFIYSASGQAPTQPKTTSGIYTVGYAEYKSIDTSRLYKPYTTRKDRLHFRPVELDIWYPATYRPSATALPFRYFVSLFERRANSFQDSTSYKGLTDELMKYFTLSNGKISKRPLLTNSYLNTQEMEGSFPLIIYQCSYNGMSYENVPMFENLASHGYIVVSVTSVGRYPGNMTTKYQDVLEQVKDAEFALHLLKNKNIDTSRTGVIGYSYGGLAATMLAIRNKSFKAVLSLDGSETHYYGRDKEEDKDFNALRQSGNFGLKTFSRRYIYLESDHKLDDGSLDSIYRFQSRNAISQKYIRLNGTKHEDFSYISDIGVAYNLHYKLVNRLTLAFADQYIQGKGTIFDSEVNSILTDLSGSSSFAKASAITDTAKQINLKGNIISEKDHAALPYVSIGIPAHDCGTISDKDGNFSLKVVSSMRNDTIRITSMGYQPRIFFVEQLANILNQHRPIFLKERMSNLKEVVITATKPHVKTVGNTSTSKFFNVGFPLRDLGSEVGIKMSLGKKIIRLRSFNFNISNLRLDTGTFRLNIYSLKDGLPEQNLLNQNILVGINSKPGAYHIDLKPYHLELKGNVFVSLEWIEGKAQNDHGMVFFSAGLLASSYHRKTTEARWESFKGLGAGFNLQVAE